MTIWRLIVCALLSVAVIDVAAQGIVVPHSAYTGSDYRAAPSVFRTTYIAGLVDGFMGAPLLGANEQLTESFHDCLLQFKALDQLMTIVDKYVADHPAEWQYDMHGIAWHAFLSVCPALQADSHRYWSKVGPPH